ncbi:hypothetical protein AJ80_05706 [Polytolypa hystricis UAMH7299]|uniref:Uncharacterized protein n=1 Tax=Polytolypa hystricis (strain UAMH7299) TaxID=1447883 RepID=A0A2B7Y1M9_POLH7|nr:hypothetical protein AJ80_05706 [Polytolypa hystricis UAMH7299]
MPDGPEALRISVVESLHDIGKLLLREASSLSDNPNIALVLNDRTPWGTLSDLLYKSKVLLHDESYCESDDDEQSALRSYIHYFLGLAARLDPQATCSSSISA